MIPSAQTLYNTVDEMKPGDQVELTAPTGIAYDTFRTRIFARLKGYPNRKSVLTISGDEVRNVLILTKHSATQMNFSTVQSNQTTSYNEVHEASIRDYLEKFITKEGKEILRKLQNVPIPTAIQQLAQNLTPLNQVLICYRLFELFEWDVELHKKIKAKFQVSEEEKERKKTLKSFYEYRDPETIIDELTSSARSTNEHKEENSDSTNK